MADSATLYKDALAIFHDAERQILSITETADAEASRIVAQAAGYNQVATASARERATQVATQAHREAARIADDTEVKVTALLEAVGECDEAKMLSAAIHAAANNPKPGINFTQHLEDQHNGISVSDVPLMASIDGLYDAIMTSFFDKMGSLVTDRRPPPTIEPAQVSVDHSEALSHIHSDTTVVMGREVTLPGGIYTVVFIALAIITALELAIAEIGLPGAVGIPLLVGLSIAKAVMVVMFYMHLRDDSRIFTYSLVVPLLMAVLITGFLMIVNPFTY